MREPGAPRRATGVRVAGERPAGDARRVTETPPDAERRLRAHRHGTSAAAALELLDTLPAVPVPLLTGRWHGAGWHTGHPWDGLLEAYGWWGKEFVDPETVRPLLVRDPAGDPYPINPAVAPVAAINALPGLLRHPVVGAGFRLLRPLLGSRRATGRLRVVEHRGTPTAALLYDRVPIVDAFRYVTDDLVVGAADIRGQDRPLLFVLRRAVASRPAGGPARVSADVVPGDDPPTDTAPTDTASTHAAPTDTPPTDTAPSDAPPPEVAKFLVRGALTVLPRRREDRDRVLRWIATRTLPLHEPVAERDLTDRLARGTRDPVGLRRELVDAGIVSRTRDGAEYWRTRVTEYDPF